MDFIDTLPLFAKVALGAIAIGIVFALVKKAIKFSLMLGALVIVVLVIMKLLSGQ